MKAKSQRERILDLYRANGGTVTHGQISKTDLYREHSARMSELRKDGYEFIFKKGKIPSENSWQMIEPVGKWKATGDGQLTFA